MFTRQQEKLKGSLKKIHVQIIGAGPAALGIFVAADRVHVLDKLLTSGMLIHESAKGLQDFSDKGLSYHINSNSFGSEFICGIRENGMLSSVLKEKSAQELGSFQHSPVPLKVASALMDDLRTRTSELMEDYPLSQIKFGQYVKTIKVMNDGGFETFNDEGKLLGCSKFCILAAGAEQHSMHSTFLTAEDVLRGNHTSTLSSIMTESENKKIVIIGGAHSAFSVANYLIEKFGKSLNEYQVIIAHRDDIRAYYKSEEDALKNGYHFDSIMDTCPTSGQVNRFSGLRHQAKKLYLDIKSSYEKRIRLHKCDGDIENIIKQFNHATFIQATGFKARRVDLINEGMKPIDITLNNDNIVVTRNAEVVSSSGIPITGLFAIGLGHGRNTPGVGEPRFKKGAVGINIFHGEDAETIVMKLVK